MKYTRNIKLIVLIIVFSLLMLVLNYFTISLSDKLIYDLQVLSLSDYKEVAKGAFNTVVGVSVGVFLLGIFILIVIYQTDSVQVLYVERSETKKRGGIDESSDSEKITVDITKLSKSSDDKGDISQKILSELCQNIGAVQALLYLEKNKKFQLSTGFAVYDMKERNQVFESGEGLTGQVVAEKKELLIDKLDPGYLKVASGLGSTESVSLLILPLISNEKVYGVLEIARFKAFESNLVNDIKNLSVKWSDFLAGTPEKKTTTIKKKKDQ